VVSFAKFSAPRVQGAVTASSQGIGEVLIPTTV